MGHDFRKNVGCLTQEVEKVLPEVIRDYDSEYKTMKYELLVPLLIEAIKELKLEIEEIKNAPTNFR